MKRFLAAAIVVLLGGCSQKAQVWSDDATGHLISAQKIGVRPNIQGVQDAARGWIEAHLEDEQLVPQSGGSMTVHRFPTLFIRGRTQPQDAGRQVVSLIAFGKESSYFVQCFGPEDTPLSLIEAHITFEGPPYSDAETTVLEIGKRLERQLLELW